MKKNKELNKNKSKNKYLMNKMCKNLFLNNFYEEVIIN
jgi:hypothetical protein